MTKNISTRTRRRIVPEQVRQMTIDRWANASLYSSVSKSVQSKHVRIKGKGATICQTTFHEDDESGQREAGHDREDTRNRNKEQIGEPCPRGCCDETGHARLRKSCKTQCLYSSDAQRAAVHTPMMKMALSASVRACSTRNSWDFADFRPFHAGSMRNRFGVT